MTTAQTMPATTTSATSQSAIRDAMSFSNLLTDPAVSKASTPELSAKSPVLEPPSTPEHSCASSQDVPTSPADTVMSELTEKNDGNGATEQRIKESVDDDPIERESEQPIKESVDDDSIEREFVCMNDEYSKCRTGQYTLALSRKVISDHFGRNKACTRHLKNNLWPLFCRKHYQRATYNKELWQVRKVKLILRQFDVIEAEFPGTTYDITLKKSEEDRLNEFSRKVAAGMRAEDAATAVAPVSGKAFEAPVDVLRELDQYIGKDKTVQDVKDAMDVVLQMLQEKETEQVPSIEFLPKIPGKMPTPKKSPVKSLIAKSPSKSPSKGSSRTSARGSVKKTKQEA